MLYSITIIVIRKVLFCNSFCIFCLEKVSSIIHWLIVSKYVSPSFSGNPVTKAYRSAADLKDLTDMCEPTFLGIASRFFPVATVMTELSGGFPKSDTLSTQHKRTISMTFYKAQQNNIVL